MARLIKFGTEARESLLTGAKTLSDVVGSTLGPRGSNVAIERQYGPPVVLHDGVSCSREVVLADKFENLGCELLKEAASKTNDAAGDGTTTATVLGYAIAAEAHRNIVAGASPMALRIGIEKAVRAMEEELDAISTPIKDDAGILSVATVSAQNDEIGKTVADGISRMGKDGVLAIEESPTTQTYLEIKEGMEFNKGWTAPIFMTNPELGECSFDAPYVLVSDLRMSTVSDVAGFLNKFGKEQTDNKNIFIIAEEVSGEALALIILNVVRGSGLHICVVQAPGFGEVRKEMLKDIATVTGATYLSSDMGTKLTEENFQVSWLGRAGRVTSTKDNTVIVAGGGTKKSIASRITELKNTLKKSESDFDREKLQERIARLTTGVGVIFVGASSDTEMRERKERFIDAVSATKAAMSEGIVPGGETALVRAALAAKPGLEEGDVRIGMELVRRAAEQPFRRLMSNAGYDEGRMLSELESVLSKKNWGIDVIDAVAKDMVESGIIDPVKVTKSALANAASCAIMMLTTSVLVVDEPAKNAVQAA